MAQYRCSRCNFRFKRGSSPPTLCPYCGKTGAVMPELSAEELLTEVDEIAE